MKKLHELAENVRKIGRNAILIGVMSQPSTPDYVPKTTETTPPNNLPEIGMIYQEQLQGDEVRLDGEVKPFMFSVLEDLAKGFDAFERRIFGPKKINDPPTLVYTIWYKVNNEPPDKLEIKVETEIPFRHQKGDIQKKIENIGNKIPQNDQDSTQ